MEYKGNIRCKDRSSSKGRNRKVHAVSDIGNIHGTDGHTISAYTTFCDNILYSGVVSIWSSTPVWEEGSKVLGDVTCKKCTHMLKKKGFLAATDDITLHGHVYTTNVTDDFIVSYVDKWNCSKKPVGHTKYVWNCIRWIGLYLKRFEGNEIHLRHEDIFVRALRLMEIRHPNWSSDDVGRGLIGTYRKRLMSRPRQYEMGSAPEHPEEPVQMYAKYDGNKSNKDIIRWVRFFKWLDRPHSTTDMAWNCIKWINLYLKRSDEDIESTALALSLFSSALEKILTRHPMWSANKDIMQEINECRERIWYKNKELDAKTSEGHRETVDDSQEDDLFAVIKVCSANRMDEGRGITFYVKDEVEFIKDIRHHTSFTDEQIMERLNDGRIKIYNARPVTFELDITKNITINEIRLLE